MAQDEIFSSLWRSIFSVFGYLDDIQRGMEGSRSQFGSLSVAQTRMLRVLRSMQEENPAGVRLKELAGKLHIGPAAASEMVDVLCRKKLLCCEPCADDRRAVSIRFADGVLDREGLVDAAFSNGVRKLCADFSSEEIRLLENLLDRMNRKGREISR